MKLILLPGMDGTGNLFHPLLHELPGEIDCSIISYPQDDCLSYTQLVSFVLDKLPKEEDFVLLAESFSGPIGYLLAKRKLANMKGVIFVATFLKPPRKYLVSITRLLPLSLVLALPIPNLIIKKLFFDKNTDNHCISVFRDTIKNMNVKVLKSRLKELSRLSLELEEVQVSTSYIQAKNDRLVLPDNIKSFKNISDKLKISKIDGPHFILQTRPKECAETIINEIQLLESFI